MALLRHDQQLLNDKSRVHRAKPKSITDFETSGCCKLQVLATNKCTCCCFICSFMQGGMTLSFLPLVVVPCGSKRTRFKSKICRQT